MSKERLSTSKLLLVIASILYLIAEITFNASLLEVMSKMDTTIARIHFVEEFGRIVSSIGFTLFVLGLFIGTGFVIKKNTKWIFLIIVFVCIAPFVLTIYSRETLYYIFVGVLLVFFASRIDGYKSMFVSVIGISLMSWTAFYYGKVAITDHYIVDMSSGQERLASKYTSLLKKALIIDSVQLEDIILNDLGGAEIPESKAFLAMLGPLSIYTKNILSWAEDDKNIESVIRAILSSKDIIDIDAEYKKYLLKRNEFKQEIYIPYAEASKKYLERHEEIDNKAKQAWSDLIQDIDNGYEKYKQTETNFYNNFLKIIRKNNLTRKLITLRDKDSNCKKTWFYTESECRNRIYKKYRKEVSKLPFNTPDSYLEFFQVNRKPTSFLGKLVNIVLGTSMLVVSEQEVVSILSEYNENKFKHHLKNQANFPLGLNRSSYENSTELSYHIRSNLNSQHDMNLSWDWKLTDHDTFYKKFVIIANKKALKKWKQKTTELLDKNIQPGLTMNQLTLTKSMQKKLSNELGDMHINNMVFSWSEREYVNKVVNPLIEKRIKKEIASFKINAKQYNNGGSKEKEGKDLFRSQIIPPIAIALSLIFSFISMSKIVPSKILRTIVFSFLIIAPFKLTNNYAESEAWKILSAEAKEDSPIITYMAEYVLRIEPLLFDLGKYFLELFNIQI
ncbi:MAG: hypothetical protein FE834_05980 [Gammaproteobacteria bacterium]|nr:hypothetical protein [Gammaproteobacteria bacterium]